jgi:uncharacterized protein YhaN
MLVKIAYFATKNLHKKRPGFPGSQKWNEKRKGEHKNIIILKKTKQALIFLRYRLRAFLVFLIYSNSLLKRFSSVINNNIKITKKH